MDKERRLPVTTTIKPSVEKGIKEHTGKTVLADAIETLYVTSIENAKPKKHNTKKAQS